MGPKKAKETDENFWRTRIGEAPLDEENWKVKVILIESAGSDQDRIYLNKFETFAAQERRFVIKSICKTETIFMINQLGGEKKVKDENLRVFEEGQTYLKDKKEIPPDLLALIIKHLILKMKEEYLFIKRQRLEVKEGMRRESTTMLNKVEVRGTVSVKPEPAEPPLSRGKGKKGEPDPSTLLPELAEGKKYNTSLRLRGEEWRDKVYVDDFPIDGPNLYVALTGFVDPYLPGCLVKIGIPLTAIVQVRIDQTSIKVPSSLFRATKRGQSQTEILTEKSLKFWEDLQELRIQKDTADDLKHTAFVVFSPPYWDSESLSGNPDKIYDELCYLMYDMQDLTRQHINYLDNIDIIHIPVDVVDDHLKRFYNQQIEELPLECVTPYLVLDSILQIVCKSEELEEKNSRSSLSTAMTLNQPHQSSREVGKVETAETFVKDVFDTLCKTEAEKKNYRLTYGEEYKTHKDPVVISYGDYAKYPTFHLGNINLDNIVWSMLLGMPLNLLWKNQGRPEGELEAKINFHVNVLLSCFDREDVETAELNRLIHVLACRKLYNNRSSLKKQHMPSSTILEFKKNYLKRSVLAEPLPKSSSIFRSCSSGSPSFPSMTKSENVSNSSNEDDPEVRRIKFLFDCPDISELVSAAEITTERPINHMIDDFEFFEDFTGISAFQIITEAFNKFNCVDYKYCEVTDCFVLLFFNSHDKDGIAREEWRCHLPTPLCLQDFFDFVLDEHYNWIQNEEKIFDEKMVLKTQSEYKDLIDPFAAKSCIQNTDVEMELLMEGSLKYQEMRQLEEANQETVEVPITGSSKKTTSPTSIDGSKSSRKIKSPVASTPKNLKQSFMSIGHFSDSSIEIPKKPFSGYDLGDRRVEVFGKDAIFFSRDCTRVSSMYTLIIPMNIEYIILNITPGNGNNEFWVHRALGDYVTPEIQDVCESFRITTKDEVMINLQKRSYRLPISQLDTNDNPKTPSGKSPSIKTSQTFPVLFETKSFHSLYITWPNGLITETVHVHNSFEISHIKQYYVAPAPNLDEDMRCISSNGEVVIFKKSGDIDVLRSDSTFITITKCEKRIVEAEVPEDLQSDVSSDKNKKGKAKEKGKDKPNKLSTKSSKHAINEDEVAPTEYDLFIEEFEITWSNGLKQKYVNGTCFDLEKLLMRTATDYVLGEIFCRRMGGNHTLLNKDGVLITTFPDKTRIITKFVVEEEEIFPEWTEEERKYFDMIDNDTIETDTVKSKASMSQKSYLFNESVGSLTSKKSGEEVKEKERTDGFISVQIIYTIEHAKFTTVTVNKLNGKFSVHSPNETCVEVDQSINYNITLDNKTSAKFNGENLFISYEACSECKSFTKCDVAIMRNKVCSITKMQQTLMKMKDSFCKKIIVNEEGCISILDEPCSKEAILVEETNEIETADRMLELTLSEGYGVDYKRVKSEASVISHGKCREMYKAKTVRFFILRRDLSCSELVHRALVEKYKSACRWQPWCSINQYDTFGDHRMLLSLLTPVPLNESEKWLMESKLADKPKHLTYKDLKKDCGKGFYHWMRPYERFEPKPMKPENVLPPRLPRAFILRTLEQQWTDEERENLKGAKELLEAILRYRRAIAADSETLLHIPIVDPRQEDERQTDDIIQALAHRIYEDLKIRLANEAVSAAQADITTAPPPAPEEMSVEGEAAEEVDMLALLAEERASLVAQVEELEPLSPDLQRYWRRRAEELKEEQFYRYLLREGSVPPYFRNVLGGAIWSDINHTAGDAVTSAERKKMKCFCAEEGTSSADNSLVPFM